MGVGGTLIPLETPNPMGISAPRSAPRHGGGGKDPKTGLGVSKWRGGSQNGGWGSKNGSLGSQNGGWGHLDPIGDPKSYGDFSTAVSARSWGGGNKMEGGGLKMGGGVTLIPMENPKSYGDFSTAVSAGSWGEGGGGGV